MTEQTVVELLLEEAIRPENAEVMAVLAEIAAELALMKST